MTPSDKQPSDKGLWERMVSGDGEAAAMLYDRYVRRLIAFARRYLDERVRPKVDEEDIAQSVFRTFYRRSLERSFNLDDPATLWPLLAEIALRKCGHWNRHFRTRKRDIRKEQTPLSDSECAYDPIDATGPRPEDGAILCEMMERLLGALDDKWARDTCEKLLQGDKIKEISAALDCSETTVNRKIRQIKDVAKELFPELHLPD